MPVAILIPLLCLMVGCVYVPWFEQRIEDGPNAPALIGPDVFRRIHLRSERAVVYGLLSEPKYQSEDGTAAGYVALNGFGTWVAPQCFAAELADVKAYAFRLVLDHNDRIIRIDTAEAYGWVDLGFYGRHERVLCLKPRNR